MKKLVVVIVVLAGVFVPSHAGASAPPPPLPPACGATISIDTVLTQDLICPTTALYVNSGVTLDLNRHTVTTTASTGGQCRFNVYSNGNDHGCTLEVIGGTVSNGTISGPGVLTRGRAVLERLMLGDDTPVVGAGGGTIRHSRLLDTSIIATGGITIEYNILQNSNVELNNLAFGVNAQIHYNRIINSPTDGISFSIYSGYGPDDIKGSITRNDIVNSGGSGITTSRFHPGGSDFGAFEISHNIVQGSHGDGIHWPGEFTWPPEIYPWGLSGPISITRNLVARNTGHGIVTGSITVGDTSHSVALFNGTNPQCVNVQCWPAVGGALG
jgi:hypothetical protein